MQFNLLNSLIIIICTTILVSELMFADDTAFVAHSHEDMQEIVTRFADAAKAFGLQVNIKKDGDDVPAIPRY